MDNKIETIETLDEIRSIMERSTRFISLNGLSGVFAGLFALIGAYFAYTFINGVLAVDSLGGSVPTVAVIKYFAIDAGLVLILSIMVAIYLSYRKASKLGVKIWDSTAKRLMVNLLIPLATGGFFCVFLIYHGLIGFVAPSMLIFYGLSLVNASKYTVNDIRLLGLTELVLGLLSAIWIGYGLLFWALGFGVAHIAYGVVMYFKYER